MGLTAIVWTISSLLLGYLILLLLKELKTSWKDQSPKRKPEALTRKEYEVLMVDMVFPDGVRGELSVKQHSRNFWDRDCCVSQKLQVAWTPPMKELFFLITQDYSNWERTTVFPVEDGDHLPEDVSIELYQSGKPFDKWTHNFLGIVLCEYHSFYYWECSCVSSLSLTDYQTSFVVAQAKCWKDITYGAKLKRIDNIKECRNKRILLERQQKEATMITQYLENKGK